MIQLETMIRLLILSGVLLGYGCFFYYKLKINVAFIPILTIASITVVMFIAGFLNIFIPMTVIITVIGFSLSLRYIYLIITRKLNLKVLGSPAIYFFLAMTICIFILLKGCVLIGYDNFSHWGLIVKEMMYFDSLPDFQSIVSFRSYPPGTACFIYYFCKIVGYTEATALMAQSLIMIASVTTLFGFVKKNDVFGVILISIVAFIPIPFTFGYSIYQLFVDSLLGCISVALIIIIHYYRLDYKRLFICILPISTMLVLTKDSGSLLFIALIAFLLYILVDLLKKKAKRNGNTILEELIDNKQKLCGVITVIIAPFICSYLWKYYVIKAYPTVDFDSNRFVVTTEKLDKIVNSRPSNFYTEMVDNFIAQLTNMDITNNKIFLMVNIAMVIFIIYMLVKKQKVKPLVVTLAATNLFVAVYLVALFCMYVFVMPENSAATNVSGFQRYYSTAIIIFFVAQSYSAILHLPNKIEAKICVICFYISIMFMTSDSIKLMLTYDSKMNENNDRYYINQVSTIANNYISRGQSNILIYYNFNHGSQKDPSYYKYIAKYELSTKGVNVITNWDLENGDWLSSNDIADYEYLLVTEHDVEGVEWIDGLGYENVYVDSLDSQVYKISSKDGALVLTSCY